MFDKIEYWLGLCDEDFITAKWLLRGERWLYTAYFCNQIAEKALKAAVANVTDEVPPKTHDLYKLAKYSRITEDLTDAHRVFLNKIARYQIEARYPEYKNQSAALLDAEKCGQMLNETEDFLCWIKQRLER
ncbi:MAG: HEPN domain-containing protein [Oscillospiraceae bacterium]|nr:HEPN domain-containing protein [Oscillospiraceae bacterium]